MKNIFEVLRQKETELVRVRREVDALKLIAPLVVDDETSAVAAKQAVAVPSTPGRDTAPTSQVRY